MKKKLTKKQISTNNEGILETIQPFTYLRGIENKDKCMGQAKNKKGEIFNIFPAPCDNENDNISKNCYCWTTARK